jgi:NTE family protein
MTADMVMASSCLPFMYQAVEIDGEAYWDGGYMGNPALFPLVNDDQSRDVVIVQINPIYREDLPRRSADILNRLNEITFNASLIKELLAIAYLKQLVDAGVLKREQYRSTLLHRISAEEELQPLSVSSKLNAEWAFLKHLHDVGYRAASTWLDDNYEALGQRSTLNIDKVYFSPGDGCTSASGASAQPEHLNRGAHRPAGNSARASARGRNRRAFRGSPGGRPRRRRRGAPAPPR